MFRTLFLVANIFESTNELAAPGLAIFNIFFNDLSFYYMVGGQLFVITAVYVVRR